MITLSEQERVLLTELDKIAETQGAEAPEVSAAVRKLHASIDSGSEREALQGLFIETALVVRSKLNGALEGNQVFTSALTIDLAKPSSDQITKHYAAYNTGDLEAFCDCFADDVTVQIYNQEGVVESQLNGMEALRDQYRTRFTESFTTAIIRGRLVRGNTTVDNEIALWKNKENGKLTLVRALVIHTVNAAGKITKMELRNISKEPVSDSTGTQS